ncbi:MAG: phenylalanine--tRNA ligase subunit beta [Candidatus Woesearchaeota archaeon]
MPTITFAPEDLYKLVGQKLDYKKLTHLLDCAKAELDAQLTHEMTIKYNDTNLPYLWSPEGLARLFRGLLGRQKGIPPLKLEKAKDKVIHDKRLGKIRPYIACFKAYGKKIDEYLLKQIIQLQEKLAENFGRKRQKISIGVYPLKSINFPVQCKAALPTELFTPLDFNQPMSLRQALERHPKGKEYGHLIKHESIYPVFIDAKKEIMSLIPVINSQHTGKIKVGDDALFFDATGTDDESVNLVANIFAYALADRGFKIEPCIIEYSGKKVITPTLHTKTIKINEKNVGKLLGLSLKSADIKNTLLRMGYNYTGNTVTIPSYRNDIMGEVDIIEDIGIAHGYEKFTPLPLSSYTRGGTFPIQHKIDSNRVFWIGLGYQEIMSPVLCNKELLYGKMNTEDWGTVEIENFISQTYSCVRTWILPQLLDVLSKNKHVDYPQKIFEQGLVSIRGKEATDRQHLAAATAHSEATFTEMRQAMESVLRNAGIQYSIQEHELGCFIPGRAAKILVNKKQVGFIGEIHPAVLDKFGLLVPVAACEIDLSGLF